ncbi:MAG: hypothetical protein RLY16_3052 [Bacteroidota bacterium]|jgi:ketosteroid isomerase-like protein
MKNISYLLFLGFFISGCAEKTEKKPTGPDPVVLKSELLSTDRAFSRLSEEQGLRVAYMEYIDSNGILLRPASLPFVAGDAIDFISQTNDSSIQMTWEPQTGEVAKSGELGYTYGVYSIKPKAEDTVYYGTYINVWKRNASGKWKLMLGSGNEGVGEQP